MGEAGNRIHGSTRERPLTLFTETEQVLLQALPAAASEFEGKRGLKAEAAHEDEDRLFGEIGRLKMELDWLKKNPAYELHRAVGMDRARL